ncbi:hypothetical protein QBC41DRAFT_344538 [Cercophora samala]|uniref:Uncharacterized protein n=1 Tax=Cercophora samala TaxID=330535 RepID=A0AA40DEP8_9PEZI|nr:hypothetical protein QBC41DRAFT_344538 [Cercophora samala]
MATGEFASPANPTPGDPAQATTTVPGLAIDSSQTTTSLDGLAASIRTGPTTSFIRFASTTSIGATCSDARDTAGVTGYFRCNDDDTPRSANSACCPAGYGCAEDRCIVPSPSTKVDLVGTCAGLYGYGACHEDVGGGCCPTRYACLSGGCMLTDKVQKVFTSWITTTTFDGTSTEMTVIDYLYPTSVDVSLTRLFQTSPTSSTNPPAGASTTSSVPPDLETEIRSALGTGAIAGIVVSCVAVAVMGVAGLFFFLRRQRRRRLEGQDDSDSQTTSVTTELAEKSEKSPSILELAEKSDVYEVGTHSLPQRVYEADTERHKVEMPCNDVKTEAWELEDTSYTPRSKFPPSNGMSAKENDSYGPAKTDVNITITTRSSADTER